MSSHLPCNDCGSSDALKDYPNNTYCFSCNTSRQKKPIKQGKSYFKSEPAIPVPSGIVSLPRTASKNFTPQAKNWLLKAGLDAPLRDKYHIRHIENEEVALPGTNYTIALKKRIILPYYDNRGALVFYQARATDGSNPKYYTIGKKELFWSDSPGGNTLVVVEDIASAIRVGEYCQAVALCGTKINNENLLTLVKNYETIYLWLDDDRAGKQGMYKLTKQLQLYNKRVVQINSQKEPKELWNAEIKTLLQLPS